MKNAYILLIVVILALVLLGAWMAYCAYATPAADTANVSDAVDGITDSLGQGTYQPVTVPVQQQPIFGGMLPGITVTASAGGSTQSNTPLPQATQPSYSPFDKQLYLSNQGSANVLDAGTATAYAAKIKSKLGMVNSFTMALMPVSTAASTIEAMASYQVQVSQVANAYYTANGTDMISDLKGTLSQYSSGQSLLAQLINWANNLPAGV